MLNYLVIGWDLLGNEKHYELLDARDDEDARYRAREEVVQSVFWGCHRVELYRLSFVERFGDPVHQREVDRDDIPF